MPLILALWRQRQVNACEFKAGLIYKVNFRTARAVAKINFVLQKQKMKLPKVIEIHTNIKYSHQHRKLSLPFGYN